ncbi:hypothetical protein [Absidia glauca]|uniref:LMBR1 domain-containing protein 2 n=1 Tax=Absidia glauca TaxID=4829 RepID=A0A163JZD0_ABSGL|nr:hypothetical protein [Absidia glauca]
MCLQCASLAGSFRFGLSSYCPWTWRRLPCGLSTAFDMGISIFPIRCMANDLLDLVLLDLERFLSVVDRMLIPMMQAYVNTGEFKVLQRLASAAKVNVRFYMIYVVVGILGLIYLVLKGGITTRMKLQGFVMAMANSWGLFLVIVFMGYGLVAVPRKLWYASDIKHHLNELYTKAPRIKEDCMDSELEFNELAKTINVISHRAIRTDDALRRMVENTVQRFPFVKHPIYADRDRHTSGIPQVLTEEYIVTLNRNMIIAARMKDRKSALWKNLLSEAYYLQDIEANKENSDRRFHSNLRPLEEGSFWTDIKARLEWWWVIMFRSILYRGLSVILGVVSICILWSELTFNIKSPLVSIVGLAIQACKLNYAAVEVLSFLILTWMCICVYTSLFKVRFFNLYLLIPHHHTDPNSLLWFTSYMCKMMAPLCYNYINLLGPAEARNSKDHTETVFSQFMGKADLVPFLGSTFIDWFPVVVLIPAMAALFHLPSLKWFGNNDDSDPENGGDLDINVAEGKELVLEERRLLERSMNYDNGASLGLMDRAKSIFGLSSSKPPSLPLSSSTDASSSTNLPSAGPLSSSLRQERDKRLDAILGKRPSTEPSAPSSSSTATRYHQTGTHDNQVPLNAKLQSFGDNVKSRLGQFFTMGDTRESMPVRLSSTTRPTPSNGISLSSPSSSPPPPPPPPDKDTTRSGGRVFGSVTNNNAAAPRPPSPNPFQQATTARGNHGTTVSPFTRFDGAPPPST